MLEMQLTVLGIDPGKWRSRWSGMPERTAAILTMPPQGIGGEKTIIAIVLERKSGQRARSDAVAKICGQSVREW